MSRFKKPEDLRACVVEAVNSMMKAVQNADRLRPHEINEAVKFAATASVALVLTQLAADMRLQTFDESAPSGACKDPVMVARDLGYRAGHNDVVRAWSKLLDEATHAGA